MSRDNQRSTALLVARGGDIEALDTYGMTPLHRMASNNLAVGARALLAAGADPQNRGCGETPLDVALSSAAHDVVAAPAPTARSARRCRSARSSSPAPAPRSTARTPPSTPRMPRGFEEVCQARGGAPTRRGAARGGATHEPRAARPCQPRRRLLVDRRAVGRRRLQGEGAAARAAAAGWPRSASTPGARRHRRRRDARSRQWRWSEREERHAWF